MFEEEKTEQQEQTTEEVALSDQTTEAPVQDSQETAPAPAVEQTIDIERNGQVEKIPMSKVRELASMGYDYTQKTQDVARQRDELKPYQELRTYWDNLVKTDPQKAQEVYKVLNGRGEDVDPRDLKLNQIESTLQNVIAENSKKEADARVNAIVSNKKYGGVFDTPAMQELLLATSLQKNDLNLKDTADHIHKIMVGVKTDTKLETEKQIKENLNAPTRRGTPGRDTKAPPATFNPSKASESDLRQRALDML